jgi:hypothetical protein
MNDNKWFLLHYAHRDDGNWKTREVILLSNQKELSQLEAEKLIRENLLDDDGHFYPLEVGLKILDGCDHEWHEIERIEYVRADESLFELKPLMDVSELIKLLAKSRKRHTHRTPGKNSSVIPSIPSLVKDVMTVLNEFWRVLFSYRGKVVLIAIHLDDFAIIEETLEVDSQSSAFEPDIREKLKRGLKRMKEIDIKPVFELRKRLMRVEKEIPR